MLPALFESLRTDQREHTLVFIGFAAEEKGLVGSRDYVHKLEETEDRSAHKRDDQPRYAGSWSNRDLALARGHEVSSTF